MLLAACASQPKRWPHIDFERPAEVEALAPPLTLGPFADRADAYNAEPPPAPADELASALFERLRDHLHEDSVRDVRIDAAARALSSIDGDAVITRTAAQFALYEQGVPEPVIGIATAHPGDVDALAAQIDPLRGYGPAAVGIGRTEGHGVVVILVRAPMFRLRAMPRHLAHGASIDVSGTLEPGLRAPTLTVTHDDGPAEHVPFTPVGTGYALRFTCAQPSGRRWLTIEALDGANVEQRFVYAPIDCGDEADRVYRTEPAANLRDKDPAHVLAAIANRERVAAGLAPLRNDLRLVAIAAQRTAGSSPEIRLLPLHDGAATFPADTLEDAAEVLLDHERTRALLRRPELTHLGIAVRPDPAGGLRVSVQLAHIPDAIDTRAASAQVLAGLQRAVAPNEMKEPKSLEKLATWYATRLSYGWSESSFGDHLEAELSVMHFIAPKLVVRTVARISDLDLASLVPAHTHFFGLSVIQAPRNGALAGRIFVVMLFAR